MTLEAYLDKSDEAGPIATQAGWNELGVWIDDVPLEECKKLDYLLTYGMVEGLDDLEAEVKHVLGKDPPDGPREVLEALLAALARRTPADDRIDVTDGVE
jgi:hypothetical protein